MLDDLIEEGGGGGGRSGGGDGGDQRGSHQQQGPSSSTPQSSITAAGRQHSHPRYRHHSKTNHSHHRSTTGGDGNQGQSSSKGTGGGVGDSVEIVEGVSSSDGSELSSSSPPHRPIAQIRRPFPLHKFKPQHHHNLGGTNQQSQQQKPQTSSSHRGTGSAGGVGYPNTKTASSRSTASAASSTSSSSNSSSTTLAATAAVPPSTTSASDVKKQKKGTTSLLSSPSSIRQRSPSHSAAAASKTTTSTANQLFVNTSDICHHPQESYELFTGKNEAYSVQEVEEEEQEEEEEEAVDCDEQQSTSHHHHVINHSRNYKDGNAKNRSTKIDPLLSKKENDDGKSLLLIRRENVPPSSSSLVEDSCDNIILSDNQHPNAPRTTATTKTTITTTDHHQQSVTSSSEGGSFVRHPTSSSPSPSPSSCPPPPSPPPPPPPPQPQTQKQSLLSSSSASAAGVTTQRVVIFAGTGKNHPTNPVKEKKTGEQHQPAASSRHNHPPQPSNQSSAATNSKQKKKPRGMSNSISDSELKYRGPPHSARGYSQHYQHGRNNPALTGSIVVGGGGGGPSTSRQKTPEELLADFTYAKASGEYSAAVSLDGSQGGLKDIAHLSFFHHNPNTPSTSTTPHPSASLHPTPQPPVSSSSAKHGTATSRISNDQIVQFLRYRFDHGLPYTYVGGRDLIAVNCVGKQRRKGGGGEDGGRRRGGGGTQHSSSSTTNPNPKPSSYREISEEWIDSQPHIHQTISWIHRRSYGENQDQGVLILGESGSGKSGIIEESLAAINAAQSSASSSSSSSSSHHQQSYPPSAAAGQSTTSTLQQAILSAHYVFNAFTTTSNYLSYYRSKASYLMDLSSDFKGDIIGMQIQLILINQWKMNESSSYGGSSSGGSTDQQYHQQQYHSSPISSESNYHIFYALLHGAGIQSLKSLGLIRNPSSYALLRCQSTPPPGGGSSSSSSSSPDSPPDTANASASSTGTVTGSGGDVNALPIHSTDWGKKLFTTITESLEVIGFTTDEKGQMWKVLAAILKLGNIDFQAGVHIDGTPACNLDHDHELTEVCNLLGLDEEPLKSSLTSRIYTGASQTSIASGGGGSKSGRSQHYQHHSVSPSGSIVRIDLPVEDARHQVNVLCWSLYWRLSQWLVSKLNEKCRLRTPVSVKPDGLPHGTKQATSRLEVSNAASKKLAFLSLPGYYRKQTSPNDLNAFMESMACEKVQSMVIHNRLREEQHIATLDGLNWKPISVENDSEILSEHLDSIVTILEQQSPDLDYYYHPSARLKNSQIIQPSSSASAQSSAAAPTTNHHHHRHHPQFYSKLPLSNSLQLDSTNPNYFIVNHYHGKVTYDASNFPEKNRECLSGELTTILFNATGCSLLRQLYPEGDPRHIKRRKKRLTATAQYRLSLTSALSTLSNRQCSNIFCISANKEQRVNKFESNHVLEQIKIFRLSELATQSSLGYGDNRSFTEFLLRYRMLCRKTWPKWHHPHKEGVIEILRSQGLNSRQYTLGKSRLFIKHLSTVWELEMARDKELHRLARLIQWSFRFWYYTHGLRALNQAQTIIAAYYRRYKQRRKFLQMKRSAQIITAYYRGWKTRTRYRVMNQRIATDKLISFFRNAVRRRYLINLGAHLPSESPMDMEWPDLAPISCHGADEYLRIIYHRWRCQKYRLSVSQQEYFRMREKLAASLIFRDKKAGYPITVGHPFRGDYVRLRQNPKWRRISLDTQDEYVVFADLVSKINRSNGKVSSVLMVLSTAGVLLLDHRTLTVKHRAPVTDVEAISLSPYADTLAVLHLLKTSSLSRKGGDYMLECRHVIELVSKLYLVIQNVAEKPPPVDISPNIWAESETERVEIVFKPWGGLARSPTDASGNEIYERVELGDRLTGCFSTSPSTSMRFSSTAGPGGSGGGATGGDRTVRDPHSPTANTNRTVTILEGGGTPSVHSSTVSDVSTPTRRMKFVRRGQQLEVHF